MELGDSVAVEGAAVVPGSSFSQALDCRLLLVTWRHSDIAILRGGFSLHRVLGGSPLAHDTLPTCPALSLKARLASRG